MSKPPRSASYPIWPAHGNRAAQPTGQAGLNGLIQPMVLFGILALVTTWLNVDLVRACRQRTAVREVWSHGGYVRREYDGRTLDGLLKRPFQVSDSELLLPKWYRSVFGEDFRNRVVAVRLAGSDACDDDLRRVAKLPYLQMLNLEDTRITDAGLRHLRGLDHLRVLLLGGTAVTDTGLAELSSLPRLEVLGLEDTAVTDSGLHQLENLLTLGRLDLGGTRVTDAGFSHLANLQRLQVLILARTSTSDDAADIFMRAAPSTLVFQARNREPSLILSN